MSKLHPGIDPYTFGLERQHTYPLSLQELAESLIVSVKGDSQGIILLVAVTFCIPLIVKYCFQVSHWRHIDVSKFVS